ncbi:epiplakin-like [Crotalus adamanteus]|uniref:Epiplakin-like n=1 Tax=Crotalus adamanteus TaxID=8729 RepID=A0AAW1BKI3_CROAD
MPAWPEKQLTLCHVAPLSCSIHGGREGSVPGRDPLTIAGGSAAAAAAAAAMEATRPTGSTAPDIRSISGVFVEGSGKTTSLAQALQDHLIQPDVALALLEAQAATGGIVDPVGERLLPVAEALAVGLAGLEMKEKLLHAERAVMGFPDPYTEEKISLYQAIQKELIGRKLGLCLLEAQIATGGVIQPVSGHRVPLPEAYARGYLDEGLSNSLSDPENQEAKGFRDPNTDQMVTYTELMRRCVADPARGLLLLPLKISFPGLRGAVCSQELLNSGVIDAAVFEALQKGEVTMREVAEIDSVQQSTSEIASIAGVAILPTNECKSLYQALVEHLLPPGAAEILMQAQVASSGYLIDPVKNAKFTVAEAVQAGVVGPELFGKLTSAERAVTGYKDPYTGETISLFQAMQKNLVPRNPGLCLLDAQLATGGVIDPDAHHRLPTRVALQRGHLDEETYSLLCNPTEEARGFFEPNSKERLSYGELLLRCVSDPDTGLCLLPLSGHQETIHTFIDHNTKLALKNTTVSVASGRFKGRPVSLWKLLFSEYLTGEQRRALTQQFSSGSLSTQQLADKIRLVVEQTTADSRVIFEGLREKVTPAQLLSSEIINRDLFEKLTQGETLVKEVISMGTVKKYLEGTGSIGGLLLPDSQERMSIYEAKRKGFLRPGTALILLEAQAATGHIIDPVANQRYSVDEALRGNIIGPDMYSKLLAAEKAVTGYKDPYTGNKISLFQAMKKDLIVKEHAIRLLEAQIATGGVIDPVNSHRLPVEVAYKRGFFEKKMSLILSDPNDDTKGFFDPNTHENLTYLQLKEKCIVEPTTGLCLLPLNSKKHQPLDDATKQAFRSSWLFVKHGRFQGQRVSLWDLLNSEYFSEGKRKEVFNHYGLRKITLEEICLALEEEMKKWACIQFPALRGKVSAYHLLERGIIDRALFEEILDGGVSPEDVLRLDSVRRYLYGTGSIGGILLQPSNERLSLYEAMKRDMVVPRVAVPLLEAQAATGFLVDPVSSQRLSLDDAVKKGLVGPELYEVLQQAEEAVTGYRDPFTGKIISLFQAMKKGLLADRKARQLMDAQLATGGVMDPHSGHYVPIEFAQKNGYLDEEFRKTFSDASSDSKAFSTLDRKERVSYGQLMDRCLKEAHSGIRLLPLAETASAPYTEEQIQQRFKETFVEDKGVSLWDLLSSSYFTEEQKSGFLEKYSSGAVSLHQLVSLVQESIDDIEMKAKVQVTFQGLRGAVPAVWLLDVGILSEKTFAELAQGKRSPREISEMESIKPYLQGTGSIAGVFIQSSKEKMGIYQAMQERLLLPGVAAQLLSAQAATGSIMDPASNQRFGVEDAIKSGIVGEELMEELLQAEKAVSGFPDPYSGKPISVCQAIRKELLPARVGIPMLEAQLATGGIIDPVHGHHLPLGAAFKHGLIDEEMQRTLSQDSKESQVFFDPNAQESLTYQQLKDRCIQDPEMGLWLLPLSKEAAFYGDPQAMEVLKSFSVSVSTGRFKGQDVSLWDLLHSEYIPDAKRRELVLRYKETHEELLQEMASSIKKIIEETEQQGKRFTFKGLRKKVSASDLFQSQLIDMTTLDELRQGKTTVQEVSEMDSVKRFLEGCNFIAGVLIEPDREKMSLYQAMRQGLLRPGAALVLLEAQAATGYLIDPVKNKKLSVDEAASAGLIGKEIYEKLLSAEKAVTGYTDPYTKGQISLFEAMNQELIVRSHGIRLLEAQIATGGIIDPVHSHRIPVEVAYKRGYFDEDLNRILLDPTDDTKGFFDPNTHENLTYLQLLERCIQDSESGLYMLQIVRRGETYFYIDEATKEFLRTQTMKVQIGRYKDQVVSVWSLLCSPYIQEQKRKDLVRQYKGEELSLPQLCKTITTIVEETEQANQKLKLKGLRGQEVSAAELFNAEIIDKVTLDRLHLRSLPLQQLTQMDIVKRYLEGTGCIAGVVVAGQGLKLLAYEAMKRGFLSPEHALLLLEAQAATGLLTDLVEEKALSVDQAISLGLVGEEFHKALLLAEKAVIGHTDPSTGDKVSLFQAMKRNLVEKAHALRLLEAQMATGGIIDPIHSHRLPVEVACRRGYLDEETFLLLSDEGLVPKGFVDPNTQERITYTQLLLRCIKDTKTGAYLLPLLEKREYIFVDEKTKCVLSSCKIKAVAKMDSVKRYLEGTNCIAGVMVPSRTDPSRSEKMTIYQAMWKGILRPGTALVLLEAQAATGFIIDPSTNERFSVSQAVEAGVVGEQIQKKLLCAERAVTGYTDPNTGKSISLFQAMKKELILKEHGIRLLEAQIATGGIIDPVHSHRLPVEVAYKRGYFDEEMNRILSDPTDDTKGFFDPNTHENLTYLQLLQRCLPDPETGLLLLHIMDKGWFSSFLNENTRKALQTAKTKIGVGLFQDQEVSAWDLLFSRYILPCKRQDLLRQYKAGTVTLEHLTQNLIAIVTEEEEKRMTVKSPDQQTVPDHQALRTSSIDPANWEIALRSELLPAPSAEQQVSAWDILFSEHFAEHEREELLSRYRRGSLPLKELTKLLIDHLPRTTSSKRHLSTDFHTPSSSGKAEETKEEGEDDAADLGDKEEALKSRMVEVTAAAFHGRKVSVWEVLHSKYIPEEKRKELLQLYQSGILTIDQMETVVSAIVNKTEEMKKTEPSHAPFSSGSWEGPLRNQKVTLQVGEFQGQRVSLWELLFSQSIPESQREELLMKYRLGSLTIQEMITTLTLLYAKDRASSTGEEATLSSQHNELERTLRQVTIDVPVGEFQGSRRSAWELLFSKYVTAAKRQELLQKYQERSVAPGELVQILITLIEEMEEKGNQLKFSGLRKQVSASELFDSRIINQDTLSELAQGTKTVEEVTEMDSVKRYLEGNSCIAGVMVPSRTDPSKSEKMTIYQAMWKGILRPGTALVLLEAQAATGFVTDPLGNKKLSVDDAVSVELVGAELREKLLSAERAVTGYKDPYTGNKLSLFQAMKKGLIVKEHGIRLLEAQIATGGIIDPVHSHRLPVEVAFKRGYFDEEMNRILSDPTDDTKGFFDPNTHENLTYLQLLQRCLPDPETGLLLLHLMDKGWFSSFLNENTRKALQMAKTKIGVGLFQDQEVSVWDLLFSRYILLSKRQDLLRQYKAGTVTIERLTQILIAIVTEAEEKSARPIGHKEAPNKPTTTADAAMDQPSLGEPWMRTLESTTVDIPAGDRQGQRVTLWDLLFSNNISEEKRTELLDLYRSGLLSTERLIRILPTLVATGRKLNVTVRSPDQETAPDHQTLRASSLDLANWESALRSELLPAPSAEQQVSAWDILFSERFAEHEREELLSRYRRGSLPLKELTKLLIDRLPRTTSSKRHLSTDFHTPSSSGKAEETKEEGEDDAADLGDKEEALKSRMVEVTAAAFHGRKVSVWEVLHSKYIPEEKRKELLQLYQSGILTIGQMETVVSAIVNKTEEMKKTEPSHAPFSSGSWEGPLRNQKVTLQVGEFQGQRVSLWELLFSQSIPESQREELLMKYRLGSLTIQEMITTLTLLHAKDRASSPGEEATLSSQHNELERTLRQVTIDVPVGEFQGSRRSAWELLFSKYVTAAKRQELLQKYQERSVAPGELVQILITLIEEMEEKGNQLKFSGLRKQVSASELFDSRIINQDTLSELAQGTKTVGEVTEMDSVKRYLEGNSCIAGVMVPSRTDPSKSEKMTIYQAMWKGILRPGTALVLLEAQAATGFVTDPLGNKKLSVDDAVSVELVGAELREKLLSAERAVTGYKDPYTGNKLSLFQAMKKGLIVKEHGIRLLEAQIATGGIIDPVHSHRLPVEVAFKRGYFDEEMNRILSDPTDDTKGFFDPNTHENLTYLQLLQRCLPDPETGLLLLHLMDKGWFSSFLNENTRKALQMAKTKIGVGLFQDQEVSVWDLLFSRYILLSKRQDLLRQYKAGTVTLERLTQILIAIVTEAEEKSARPIGHKEAPNKPTTTADAAMDQPSLGEPWMRTLESTTVDIPAGDRQGQRVTLWDLLFSNNISEEKRTELLDLYKSRLLSTERLIRILPTLVATGRKLNVTVRSPDQETAPDHQTLRASSLDLANWESALRSELLPAPSAEQQVSAWDILFSERFAEHEREELLSRYRRGSLPLKELTKLLIDRLPRTTSSKHHLSTDFHTPSSSGKAEETKEEGEDDAADLGDKEEALKSRMVEVTAAAFHGRKVSVWEVLHSKYIPEEKRKELLQLYQSGILTIDQMETVVSAIVNKTEEMKKTEPSHAPFSSGSWEGPLRNQKVTLQVGEFQGQRVSLWELLFSQSIPESQREELLMKYRLGSLTIQEMIITLTLLHAKDRASSPGEEATLSSQHNELERTLRQVTIDVPVGEFQGSRRSVWELLFSKYVTAAKRQELLQKYQERSVAPGELVQILITLIEEMEEKGNQLKFSGLRKQVSASELFDSRIINQDTLSELAQGTKTVEEVTEMDSVKRYLEGNSCIAGVMVPSRTDPSKSEKMTIYQAMWKGILRPGTALVLLEAQAATGFVTDPLGNKKLSVDDAVSVELVGAELREKLLSAERAVTGYKDPYTGNKLSLFQAMKKGLIVKEHGIRLLEAQIATGGIIDPVHSHRLPVEVAFKRGYFDEEMNRILSDPTDDTKGFFDPNTHENLTYLQLLQRCLPDPETGLLLLHLMDKGWFSSFLNENTRKALQMAKTKIGVGLFQDQEVSVWDLLFSRYILLSKRQDLLRQYKAGTVTIERLTQILIAIVTEAEEKSARPIGHKEAPNKPTTTADAAVDQPSLGEPWMRTLESTTVDIPAGDRQGQRVTLWDLLFSNNISEGKRTELLDLYKSRLLSTERLIRILPTLVATGRKLNVTVRSPDQETAPDHQTLRASSLDLANWESALRSELLPAPSAEQQVSAWDILFSERFAEHEREELLSRYRRGSLPLKELTKLLIDRLPRTTSSKRHLSTDFHTPSSSGKAEETKEEGEDDAADLGDKEEALKSRMVEVTAAAFHGRKVSVWEVLHSKYIPEEKRKELLQLYQSGILTIDQMETVVSAIVNKTEEMKSGNQYPSQYDLFQYTLELENISAIVRDIKDQRTSVWDPFFSRCVSNHSQEISLLESQGSTGSVPGTAQGMSAPITQMGTSTDGASVFCESAQGYISSPKSSEESLAKSPFHSQSALKSRLLNFPVAEFPGKEASLWDVLPSHYVSEEKQKELLRLHQLGDLNLDQMESVVSDIIHRDKEGGERPSGGFAASSSPDSMAAEDGESQARQLQLKKTLRTTLVPVTVGEYQGQRMCVLDLLFSKYVPQDNRQELLELYRAGALPIEDMISRITVLLEEAESQREKRETKKRDVRRKERQDQGDDP